MFTNCTSSFLEEQSVSKPTFLCVLSSNLRPTSFLFKCVLYNLLFVNNDLQVSSIRLLLLWCMHTKLRSSSNFCTTHAAILSDEEGRHSTELLNFPATLLSRIRCPKCESDHSSARNVSIQVKWNFVLNLSFGLEFEIQNLLFVLNRRQWNYKKSYSRPYAKREGMQGNGCLYPFILDTHSTSKLFSYLHPAANLPAARKPPRSSKYETNNTHIGEGLCLFVFGLWIAAYESSTFFLNVRPRHPVTS